MAFTIKLTKGFETLIDDCDRDLVAGYRWYTVMSGKKPYAFAARVSEGKRSIVGLSRLIVDAPAGLFVDHISGDSLDNRRANLRICTRAQNMQNRPSLGGASKYKGVVRINGTWGAHVAANCKRVWLGCFPTEDAAARAYDDAAKQYHGTFARLNFPEAANGL